MVRNIFTFRSCFNFIPTTTSEFKFKFSCRHIFKNKQQEKFLHEVKIQKSETVCSRWFIVCSFFMKRTEVILFIACGVYPELVEGSLTSAVRTFLRSYEIQATSYKTFSNFQISNYDNTETVFDPFCK